MHDLPAGDCQKYMTAGVEKAEIYFSYWLVTRLYVTMATKNLHQGLPRKTF